MSFRHPSRRSRASSGAASRTSPLVPGPARPFGLVLTLLFLVACDAPSDGGSVHAPRPEASAPAEGTARDGHRPGSSFLERTALDPGTLERDGAVEVEVGEDAVSLLFTAALEDEGFGIGITRVEAPDGRVVHESAFEDDSWDAVRFASDIVAEPIVGNGDIALYVPTGTGDVLAPGTWRIELETDPPDARFVHATATVRTSPDDVDLDALPHTIDVHVHVIHRDPDYRESGFGGELDTAWRTAIDRVLVPHALLVGTITRTVSPPRETSRLAELDDEREIASACRAVRRAAAAAGVSGGADVAPVLHVGLVGTITSDGAADYTADDLDGPSDGRDVEDEGGSPLTGLSPQPGLPFDEGSSNACAFIAEEPWREPGADGAPLAEATVVELLVANLLHELGHFAGLAHPSEADGRTFDLLDDTPRCTEPDVESCGLAGGAGNLMFHSGDERTLPWTLTPDQARVLRVHPLFRPLDTSAR